MIIDQKYGILINPLQVCSFSRIVNLQWPGLSSDSYDMKIILTIQQAYLFLFIYINELHLLALDQYLNVFVFWDGCFFLLAV